MNTIRGYAAEDATVIFGTAYDDSMRDSLRVTVVATGLGRKKKGAELVHDKDEAASRTGTDDAVIDEASAEAATSGTVDVLRNPRASRRASEQVRALETAGMDHCDIPAFSRK